MASLGNALILASLLAAAVGSVVAFVGGARHSADAQAWARKLAYAFSFLLLAANGVMITALLTHDFSVSYVAHVGARNVPTWVTVVSLWSSLEGSILFWGAILAGYVGTFTWANRNKHQEYMPWVTGVLLACGIFFTFLIAGPANPFHTVVNPASDGPGPNPLLQNHILMVIHPPTLYLGYVGMTIPFSIAAGALMAGRLGSDFVKTMRFWMLVPWTFQTIGIILGGWWAYEVLGWGGYWSWDPVENASLLPWLTATAAVHSVLVVERRGFLKGWTVTLTLSTFLLTILGTFMTRSGVFNSVHSFTQSDIGPTFLVFLAMGLFFSVFLLAARIGKLEAEGRIDEPVSREGSILVNNLLFVLLTLTVLLGTTFPLIVEAVQNKQISVGEPYFNRMSVPLGVAVLFLMGIGPALPWGRAGSGRVLKALLPPLAGALVLTGIGLLLGARAPWLLVTLFAGGYALQVTFAEMTLPVRQRMASGKEGLGAALGSIFGAGRRRFGAYVIHAGLAMVLIAVAVSSTGKLTAEGTLAEGQSMGLGPYSLTFLGVVMEHEPHRESTVARVSVSRGGQELGILEPRMNHYRRQREPVGTPAVLTTAKEDVYLSMASYDPGAKLLGLRAFKNPMVVWIWIGTAIMTLGALFAGWPLRKAGARAVARQTAPVPAAPAGEVGPA